MGENYINGRIETQKEARKDLISRIREGAQRGVSGVVFHSKKLAHIHGLGIVEAERRSLRTQSCFFTKTFLLSHLAMYQRGKSPAKSSFQITIVLMVPSSALADIVSCRVRSGQGCLCFCRLL